MSTNSVSYPYPVVGNSNDIDGRFVVNRFERSTDPDNYTFRYDFEVTNKSVSELISQKKAQFVLQVECSGTFQRFAIKSFESTGVFQLPTSQLREKVTIRLFVCATENLEDYSPDGMHEDYEGIVFSIERGDVVAVGGTVSFIAEKTFDPLRAPYSSLFRIKKGKIKGQIQADFEQDKILIIVPEDNYKDYVKVLSRKMNDNIHATVVFPVLVEALNLMKKQPDDFRDLTWFDRIDDICRQRSYNRELILETAQKILSNPVGRNFKELEVELSKYEEDDE